MFNLEPESSSPMPGSPDPIKAGINGMESSDGMRSPSNLEFGAESALDIEKLMPGVEEESDLLLESDGLGVVDVLTGGSADGVETATRGASATNPNAVDVHRFWDEQTQSHFFTADETEFDDLLANSGRYRYEGVEFEAPLASVGGAQPVYRFENQTTDTFFYTLQSPDVITGDFPVLESDGIAFYAFSTNAVPPSGAVPIYRFFNEGASARTGTPVHFYTGTDENRDTVRENFPSFTDEGPGWYAYGVEGSDVDPEPTDPGNTLSAAFNIGDLTNRTRSFNEFVGSVDSTDVYKFDLSQTSDVSLVVGGKTDDLNVWLVLDENNNGQRDSDETLSFDSANFRDEAEINSPLGAGVYFIEISTDDSSDNTNYTLELTSTPTPPTTSRDPGDSLNTAFNLGNVTGRSGSLNEFVGSVDSTDIYRLELSQTSDLSVLVNGKTDDLNVWLVLDENNNGQRDSDETISFDSANFRDEAEINSPLGAGTYFLEISTDEYSDNTNYTLRVSSQ